MTKLDRIQIKGFKSIRELDLPLGDLNVLIGANGSGKSNLIQVFELLNYIVNQRLQLYVGQAGGANNLLYFGRKTTEMLELHFQFSENEYRCFIASNNEDNLLIVRERLVLATDDDIWTSNAISAVDLVGYEETMLDIDDKIDTQIRDMMLDWKVYQFHDTSESAPIKQTQDLEDNRLLKPDGANLAPFLYYLKQQHPAHYQQIVVTIRLVTPFFDDFVLEPSRLNPDKIRLRWQETQSPPDTSFSASALSDGTLRFMALATLLLQPDLPATILIDEPELGLHPFAINILVDLLESASTKTQVIVATQSVPLVNQLQPEDIIVVDRIDGQSTFKRPTSDEIELWLDDYGLGDLWEKNVIGGRPQP